MGRGAGTASRGSGQRLRALMGNMRRRCDSIGPRVDGGATDNSLSRSADDLNRIVQVERGAGALDYGSEGKREANRRGGPHEEVVEAPRELVVGAVGDDLTAEQVLVGDFRVCGLAGVAHQKRDRPRLVHTRMMRGRVHRGDHAARGAAHDAG